MNTRPFLSLLVVAVASAIHAPCETPLAKPAPVHVCSKNFCVDSTPGRDTVFSCRKKTPDSDQCHWTLPGWHRHLLVSDFAVVAVVYDGGNLLPLDFKPDMVLIELWKNGLKVREIHASEIEGIRERRTVSHYEWGVVRGFDENYRLIVTTSKGKRVTIAAPPEPQYDYFPSGTVDAFKTQWYGRFLRAYEEPSLWEASRNTSSQTYRFTWLRTFNHPVVIRLTVRPDGICELTTKVGLGAGGYDPGMLIRDETRALTKDQSKWILGQIEQKFWNYPKGQVARNEGLDGAQWIFEGVRGGQYRIEDQWSPTTGPIRDLGLAMAIQLAGLTIPAGEIY